MTSSAEFEFSWDESKAKANVAKHGVSFLLAVTIFNDPLALTVYDSEHSAPNEERWVTIGKARNGQYLVVVHKAEQTSTVATRVRIISARKADRDEVRDYENIPKPWRIEEQRTMKDHYDFSKGVRGKFYKPDAVFHLPVYLNEDVEKQLTARARAKGMDLSDLVNEILKAEIDRKSK